MTKLFYRGHGIPFSMSFVKQQDWYVFAFIACSSLLGCADSKKISPQASLDTVVQNNEQKKQNTSPEALTIALEMETNHGFSTHHDSGNESTPSVFPHLYCSDRYVEGTDLVIKHNLVAGRESVELRYGLDTDHLKLTSSQNDKTFEVYSKVQTDSATEAYNNNVYQIIINKQGKALMSISLNEAGITARVNGLPLAGIPPEIDSAIATAKARIDSYLFQIQGFIRPTKRELYDKAEEQYRAIIPDVEAVVR